MKNNKKKTPKGLSDADLVAKYEKGKIDFNKELKLKSTLLKKPKQQNEDDDI